MGRVDSLEKTLMLGGIRGRKRRGHRGWDGWMASLTQCTWVWVNSGSWWWTGRPGVLRFIGSQSRTRLSNWTELNGTNQIANIRKVTHSPVWSTYGPPRWFVNSLPQSGSSNRGNQPLLSILPPESTLALSDVRLSQVWVLHIWKKPRIQRSLRYPRQTPVSKSWGKKHPSILSFLPPWGI